MLCLIYSTYCDEELTIENCKCWKNYQPVKSGDSIQCDGTLTLSQRECNVPEPPECKCTTSEVNGILHDDTGVYCSYSVKGENEKKWKCENEEEWKKYEEEYKAYEEKRKATTQTTS